MAAAQPTLIKEAIKRWEADKLAVAAEAEKVECHTALPCVSSMNQMACARQPTHERSAPARACNVQK